MNVTGRGEGVVERGGLHRGGNPNNVGCLSSDNGKTYRGPATACHALRDAGGVVHAIEDVGPCNVMTVTTSTMAGAAA